MSKSATDIIPEEFMNPENVAEVIAFLQGIPVNGTEKKDILAAWSRAVGVKLSGSQYASVVASGIDNLVGF